MSFKLQRVETLFPTPLVIADVPDHVALNARLLAEIAERRAAEPSQDRSNRHGWHSATDLFRRAEPAQADLAQRLIAATLAATRKLAPELDPASLAPHFEGWININPAGAYNAPHDHSGALWSGCYYVHVPEMVADNPDAGSIEFLNPRPSTIYSRLVQAGITADKTKVRPSAGMLLLFPGHLRHWVHPHQSGEERVTIAFNASFRRVRPEGAAQPRS